MTEDKNQIAASYDWWSHAGSVSPMPPKIMFRPQASGEPIMTIHPDGRITLGENAQPTEAAAACIDAMSHMIQRIIDRAVSEECAAIVAWMRENSTPHNDIDEWADEIEAGVHLK